MADGVGRRHLRETGFFIGNCRTATFNVTVFGDKGALEEEDAEKCTSEKRMKGKCHNSSRDTALLFSHMI